MSPILTCKKLVVSPKIPGQVFSGVARGRDCTLTVHQRYCALLPQWYDFQRRAFPLAGRQTLYLAGGFLGTSKMRKSLILLAVASSLLLAPSAFAAERVSSPSVSVEAGFVAPAPQTANRTTLAQAHSTAASADQAKTAGRIPGPVVMIGAAVLVAVIVVVS